MSCVYKSSKRREVQSGFSDRNSLSTVDRANLCGPVQSRFGVHGSLLYLDLRWNSKDVSKDVKDIEDLLDRVDFHIVGASQGLYPVNTLRNVAINKAKTVTSSFSIPSRETFSVKDFIIMADVDFVPSAGLYEAAKYCDGLRGCVALLTPHPGRSLKSLLPAEQLMRRKSTCWCAFYVPNLHMSDANQPAFEIDGEDQVRVEEVCAHGNKVHNDKGRSIAHKYTEYDKWIEASEPYKVSYKFPYEPYILGLPALRRLAPLNPPAAPRTIPRFDVRFFGYGNDKASHNYELNAAGYEFWVFPKHFVVHIRHSQVQEESASL
eukprot:748309-Hanusia_phi.AAC.7